MYGISSFAWASQRRSSQASRAFAPAGARAMIVASSSTAWLTAVPMAPEEPSTCSRAGETRSRNSTAPSAPRTGSRRATFLISLTACLTRAIAGCDFQPKAPRRMRRVNVQEAVLALDISVKLKADGSRYRGGSAGLRSSTGASPRRRRGNRDRRIERLKHALREAGLDPPGHCWLLPWRGTPHAGSLSRHWSASPRFGCLRSRSSARSRRTAIGGRGRGACRCGWRPPCGNGLSRVTDACDKDPR